MASEKLLRVRAAIAAEMRRHPWAVPGMALTASAALGTVLPGIVALIRGALS